ncbi:MAG: flagellar hook-basal body complex protein [Lachnospiraceae bacterium]|nr:flagellar hook-basal body complex protein [Lachnospiraceae bacterium]
MNAANMTYPPDATTQAVMSGNVDSNDSNVKSAAGRVMTLEFYDDRGYLYTAKFSVKQMKNADGTPMTTSSDEFTDSNGASLKDENNRPLYSITLMDILDNQNESIGADKMEYVTFGESRTWKKGMSDSKTDAALQTTLATDYTTFAGGGSVQNLKSTAKAADGKTTHPLAGIAGEYFGLSDAILDSYGKDATYTYDAATTTISITSKDKTNIFSFDPDTGALISGGKLTLKFDNAAPKGLESFQNVAFDASTLTNVNTNGSSTFKATKGDLEGNNTGRMIGEMNGISVEVSGKIWASYSNGQSKLLGQIASAEFANASGLEKSGDNLYKATNNSGEATIQDITTDGGRMNTGVLEMSNVDLSQEFTTMITTQRGFQANSRIITVSDTLLEELTNLKR